MTEPVFLVTGEDEPLRAFAVSKILRPFKEASDLAVETVVEHGDVVAALRNVSLFTPQQVVVYQGKTLTEGQTKEIIAYLRNPEPTSVLVLSLTKAPKFTEIDPITKVETKFDLLAEVKKAGGVHQAAAGKNRHETGRSLMEGSPVVLDGRAKQLLLEHVGENVSQIPSLLDVLSTAYGTERVTVEMLSPFLGEAGEVPTWDLTDAIDKGDTRSALLALGRILQGREPVVVANALQRHFEWMFKLSAAGVRDEKEGAALVGLRKGASTYPVKKAIGNARLYGSALPMLLELTSAASDDIHGSESGSGLPRRLVLEVLTARLASYPRR